MAGALVGRLCRPVGWGRAFLAKTSGRAPDTERRQVRLIARRGVSQHPCAG